ncbi:unnamed protein product, partial [Rotaria magnacalcarata]
NQTNNLFLEIRKHHWCCKLLSDPTTGDNSLKTTMSTFAKVRTRVIFLIGIFTALPNTPGSTVTTIAKPPTRPIGKEQIIEVMPF